MRWSRYIAAGLLTAGLTTGLPAQDVSASERACRDNLELLMRSARKYAKDHQGRMPESLQQLVPKYLASLPRCPLSTSDSYSHYTRLGNDPPRLVLICACANHELSPPDYLVLSSDREWEKPFTNQADPSLCRRTLVTLGQELERSRTQLGHYPPRLEKPLDCSCGDPIRYSPSSDGQSFIAYCPGAAHLGSGLAPFSPALTPRGLQEDNFWLGTPRAPTVSSSGHPGWPVLATGTALLLLTAWLFRPKRARPIRLD